ncbi:hypothetical protein FOCG_18132 [Fusarium oxysporum f. sp. radicis-lycopersici 26381]|nr:hypothetical protein FOCG_18132 [Fusarium oxysporum f. sp. radicis-lycopersici 26381]
MDSFSIKTILSGIDTILATNVTIDTIENLPKAFSEVKEHLPLVKDKLIDAQPKLEEVRAAHHQSVSALVRHCSDDVTRLKDIFKALENQCRQGKDQKTWATLRLFYLQTLERKKDRRVECLATHLLGRVKELCLHETVRLSTEDIDEALKKLAKAEPSLEDSEFDQAASIANQQTVNEGGFGQQNTPVGGNNTFNSGHNISGGTVYYGRPPPSNE